VFARIYEALADLATDPEGKLALDLGCDNAGKGDRRREVDEFCLDRRDTRKRPLCDSVLPAADKESERNEARA
jgi:hypothetical protein